MTAQCWFVSRLVVCWSVLYITGCSDSGQQTDPNFVPKNQYRSYPSSSAPIVAIDQAHHNFLTAKGRYRPFALVLASDGYRVQSMEHRISTTELNKINILVIANALDRDRTNWQPPYQKAFSEQEVATITQWVGQGGALFLVADHTPFPQMVDNLAKRFGFTFSFGHVGNATFQVDNHTLTEHPITIGNRQSILNDTTATAIHYGAERLPTRRVSKVVSFGGSAFKPPDQAVSLLQFDANASSLEPAIPFQVTADTPKIAIAGWSQGAVLEYGKGRIAVFAEGMMFSSQLDHATGKTLGLSSVGAEQNEAFLLNVMHWLSGDR